MNMEYLKLVDFYRSAFVGSVVDVVFNGVAGVLKLARLQTRPADFMS